MVGPRWIRGDHEWFLLEDYGNAVNKVRSNEEGIWRDRGFILNVCFSMKGKFYWRLRAESPPRFVYKAVEVTLNADRRRGDRG